MNETRNIYRIFIRNLYGKKLITKNILEKIYTNITVFSDEMPAVWLKGTDVSEEFTASIFRAKNHSAPKMEAVSFLRNVVTFLPGYMLWYPMRQLHIHNREENQISQKLHFVIK
jgi:hypothetical protein